MLPSLPQSSLSSLLLLASLSPLVTAVNIDCKAAPADGKIWDLSALAGPKSIYKLQSHLPNIKNTTFSIDLCAALRTPKGVSKKERCPNGSRVCAIETLHKPDDTKSYVEGVIPIAGEFSNGRHLDPYWTRLSTSSHPGDHDREGLRLKMGGGYFADRKQEAVIEFLCSKEVDKMTLRRRTHPELLPRREKDEEEDDEDDEDDDDDDKDKDKDEDEEPDLPHDGESTSDGAGGILKFTSYDLVGESKVLNLEWQTPHACEDSAKDGSGKGGGGKDGKSEGGGHWGFFTWLIIIVFLLTAAYLIFGSWLNYNRYSARGWDLLPHSETLRDLPYLFREWGRKAVDTVQGRGGGSRGGYSAV